MGFNYFLLRRENHIATISINRPEHLNSLNREVLEEMDQLLDEIQRDDTIHVFILTGEGRAFVAGADITEMKAMSPDQARQFAAKGSAVFRKIELMEKPSIAAVNGFALGGGCELALACDIRVASEKAKFGQPEVGLGIIPGFSGTIRLGKLVGEAKAKELIFTGEIIGAKEALSMGLVNHLYPPDEVLAGALKIAEKIAEKSSVAVGYAKAAIARSREADMATAMELENSLFGLCFAEADQQEGMDAFVNKRKPEFKGK